MVCCGYGHVGDGNLHLNITLPGYLDKELQTKAYGLIDTFVMEYTRDAKGSISAEHGVGLQKPHYLSYSKSPEMIRAMKLIKNAFDPNGIMNPYKVLI
jgi:FAD/FMN-containing dehydrogenase